MITRLWIVMSLAWAALILITIGLSPGYEFAPVHVVIIFGPLILGIILKRAGRYIVTGQ